MFRSFRLALWLLLALAASGLRAAPLVHGPTGIAVPDAIAGFARYAVDDHESQSRGLGVAYHFRHAGGDTASLYLYTAGVQVPSSIDHATMVQLRAQTVREIAQAAQGRGEAANPLDSSVVRVPTALGEMLVLEDRFTLTGPGGKRLSTLGLWTARGHFAKVRITSAPGREGDATLHRAFQEAAVRLTTVDAGAATARRLDVVLARGLNDVERPAWVGYGTALANWAHRHSVAATAPLGMWLPTLEAEVHAREALVKAWREMGSARPLPALPYMEQLLKVVDAGYLREYIWAHHRRPSWGEMPAGLRQAAYAAWAAENIRGHVPQTQATVSVVPGQ
jgi:hypothetical protein